MESLIRWQSPKHGLVLPFDFIPLIEKNGMIIDIGYHILYKSCEQTKKWQDMGYYPMRVAVNLSPYQISQPNLVSDIERIMKKTALEPRWLELEITETGIVGSERKNIEKLEKLRELVDVPNIIYATIEFVDIAGLVKGASQGEGLGNQFLSHVRNTDALIHVVRGFDDPNVVHVHGSIDPQDDIEVISIELALADLGQLERKINKLESEIKGDKKRGYIVRHRGLFNLAKYPV